MRQIESESCYKQTKRGNHIFGTNLLGVIREIFRLDHRKPKAGSLSYEIDPKAEYLKVTSIRAQIESAQAQFRKLQMTQ